MTAAGTLRLLGVGWWLQLKIHSRSAFDGILGIFYPLFFATSIFFIYGQGADEVQLVSAAVGAAAMGVWSAVSTSAAISLQRERNQGTLELLVAAPTPFPLLVVPITLSMATIGLYSFVATLLWGRFAFGIQLSLDQPLAFVAGCLATAVAIGLMGFLLAISAIRYRSSWALGAALEMPIWLICGFIVPLALLPDWVRPIAWVLPPTWGVAAVKDAALGGSPWPDIVLCLGIASIYAAIGTLLAHRLVDSARTHATLSLS
ncbi:MAG TPA: ABC transporter permease [Actinomycetes bacterium]|nr:ABC transporter permease [Actinomycetes bacterium]